MKANPKGARLPLASLTLFVLFCCSSVAQAQATRTWVSGVGDDANPCSRTAPCKTFAGAISKTAPGGEIDVLDPGGFGAVTIAEGDLDRGRRRDRRRARYQDGRDRRERRRDRRGRHPGG